MGGKSSNAVAKKEMLPLFQVLSDLEKPLTSSISLKTNVSSNLRNSALLSENDITSPCSNTECNFTYCECCLDKEYIDDNLEDIHHVREVSNKKLNKKRRRLKRQLTVSSSSGNLEHFTSHRQDIFKEMSIKGKKSERSKKHSKKKNCELEFKPEIHSTIERNDRFLPEIEKRTGMFSTMTLNEIDQSRSFKDSSNDDLQPEIENFRSGTDCPVYEVPNDVIKKGHSSSKKKRKILEKKTKMSQYNGEKSVSKTNNGTKISKKTIIKNYESMLKVLIEKCEQKDSMILEKDDSITKMKKKLKQVLFFNNQFAEENEYMKSQHNDMKNCIERYKNYVSSLESHQQNNKELRRFSDLEIANQTACARCSIMELSAIKIEKENTKLNEDVVMLKNVVFRLNVQLSRYQEKLRSVHRSNSKQSDTQHFSGENEPQKELSMPSLPVFVKSTDDDIGTENEHEKNEENKKVEDKTEPKLVYKDCLVWGDVNTHTLAPLLNAYQESLMEKDDLIRDYEKEFNRFTSKLKEIILENNDLHDNFNKLKEDFITSRETAGLAITERDDLRKENYMIKEKLSEVQEKLKNFQDSYEQKVQSMARDYTLIHQEYFKTKTGLAVAQGRCQALEDQQKSLQGENVIPAKIHMLKIEECQRMFEELKNKYELDKSKYSTRISILEENNNLLEKKHIDINNKKHDLEIKIRNNNKILRKYQHSIMHLNKEITALKSSRDTFKRRAIRATTLCRKLASMLNEAMGDDRLQHLKTETMAVRKEAMKELEALEARMKEQDLNLAKVKEENIMELSKLENLLREKDAKIEAMKRHIEGERLSRYISHPSSAGGRIAKLESTLIDKKIYSSTPSIAYKSKRDN